MILILRILSHCMLRKFTFSLLIFAFSLGLWQLSTACFPQLLFILPSPSKIFITMWENKERLLFHSLSTLKEMAGGFFLAFLASFPLAWMMLRFKTSRSILQPFFIVIQCLPMFTIAPLMVIWFGWGYTAIVIPTALMIFFPLTLNIYQGLKSTPLEFLEFFKANQASPWQTFLKLRLPFAVPHIFAGFRISAAIAGIGAVAGEWAGAQAGLGILMLESRRNTDLEMTFSALFLLTFLSFSFYGLVVIAEKLALPPRRFKLIIPSFRLKKRLLVSLLVLSILGFEISACYKKESHETRLLLDWLPNPNHVPLFSGVDQGFFKEENIHLSLQKMHDAGGGISYLTSHQADLIVSHMPSSIRAQAKGAHLKIVGTLIKEPLSCFIFLQTAEGVKTPSDLCGKVLGYCMGTPDTVFLDYLLNQGNIIPKEKRFVGVDFISALGTQKVDFIYGGYWNIEPFLLASLGVKNGFFRLKEFNVPSFYEMIILANEGSKEADPDFVKRFQRALQKSIDFAVSHPEEAFDSYLKSNPDKRDKTLLWEKKSWEATAPILCKDQAVELECLERLALWLEEQKVLAGPFQATSLIP